MQAWTIISGILSLIAIPSLIGLIWKFLWDKKVKKDEHVKELEDQEKENKIRNVVREEINNAKDEINKSRKEIQEETLTQIQPMLDKLDKIESQNTEQTKQVAQISKKLALVGNGTLCSLRDDILSSYYKCSEKHFRNDYDYKNIHDLYDAYKQLDGNSFVKDVISRFDALPTKEEYEGQKKRRIQNPE